MSPPKRTRREPTQSSPSPRLAAISITGLFGLYDHAIALRDDPPITIVAGPNGIGKTTLLALAHALMRGNLRELVQKEFRTLRVAFDNGSMIIAERELPTQTDDDSAVTLTLSRLDPGEPTRSDRIAVQPRPDVDIPPHLEQIGPETFVDLRSGEHVPAESVYRRYSTMHRHRSDAYIARAAEELPPDWLTTNHDGTEFIETKRLDSLIARRGEAISRDRYKSPIHVYLDAIRDTITSARQQSFAISQQRDRTFARRLLSKSSRLSVNEDKLRLRYSNVEGQAERLKENGLLADSLDILPRGEGLNPTEKRILSLFLDDFEAKLEPLRPASERIDHLREIVQRKFLNKTMSVDARAGVTFWTKGSGLEITPESLSSGEQHELALASRLLFSVQRGTTVLIDEPELSLHVSWQHAMLGDLERIAELAGLAFVLATHSTAVINNRWELVEELAPLDG